ncbi:MAG: sugar ABC transporter permease [Chloroflexota bacterium]|nr:sugar ABC transporter permease [Chloroflexota bacterium]
MIYIIGLVAVPFLLALKFSLTDATVSHLNGVRGFIGLENFTGLLKDQTFRAALKNTFIYSFSTAIINSILGTTLAFILLAKFRGKKIVRYLVLLPWTIPIALTIQAWKWMYQPQYSVLNWLGKHTHIITAQYGIQWIGQPKSAMVSIIMVNVWRNFPFSAVILLAGLTSIPQDIIDAAKIDGANWVTRYRKIIVPMIAPILFIGVLFNLVFNFTDLTIVYLLTQGGPGNATEVLATYAFKVGIAGGQLGRGAAVTLFLFPVLFLFSIVFLIQLRKREI